MRGMNNWWASVSSITNYFLKLVYKWCLVDNVYCISILITQTTAVAKKEKHIMALNHINIPVSDPVGMQEFLIKYLGMTAMRPGSAAMALATDENDMQLVLMGPRLSGEDAPTFPKVFHIGFRQKTEQAVNQIYQKMTDDGLDVAAPAKAHGAWAFYYRSPWNVMIEVVA